MDKDTARQTIAELVSKFQSDAKRNHYTEQQTREYFILPLFRALGWNTENPAEFTAEEKISNKFVDFGFYVGNRPAFYLETKAVNEKLDQKKFIDQSINYSYMRDVTWAVLTDFEKLYVFNAEWDTRDFDKDRMFEFNHAEYSGEKFDDLWLLSKPAMSEQPRPLDVLAARVSKKARREPVTSVLFAQLTEWRQKLFRVFTAYDDMFAKNPREVDNAVQRLIDRLIFIRTLEDREVESSTLQPLIRQLPEKKLNDLFPELLRVFRAWDKIYNSNLFTSHTLDVLQLHEPDLLRDILRGLYQVRGSTARYDFNAITADILGAVYEQYLSFKAFDPTGKRVFDLKTQKRKKQGIFYTPEYIVRYIVGQTLEHKLADSAMTPAKAHTLRVLDPACGSGSFLIAAFDVLDAWFAKHEPDVPPRERRERILRENLFSVDLDEQAIEVARLNLLLRAAHERRLLPKLDHLRTGNSIIADDAIAGKDLGFKWHETFADVLEGDKGGFDVIIGNPPYVRQETLGTDFKSYAQQHYATYAGTADLYTYFIEKGATLLKADGRMGYIVPNKWMRANYGKNLRQFLQDKIESIVDFGDLPLFSDAITYPCIITLASPATSHPVVPVAIIKSLAFTDLKQAVGEAHYQVARVALDRNSWTLADERGELLIDKLSGGVLHSGNMLVGKSIRELKLA